MKEQIVEVYDASSARKKEQTSRAGSAMSSGVSSDKDEDVFKEAILESVIKADEASSRNINNFLDPSIFRSRAMANNRSRTMNTTLEKNSTLLKSPLRRNLGAFGQIKTIQSKIKRSMLNTRQDQQP